MKKKIISLIENRDSEFNNQLKTLRRMKRNLFNNAFKIY